MFRLFKSEARIDETRSQCPYRVLCELYAKLLGQMVQQWALLAAGYQMLRHIARRASRRVRKLAPRLLAGLETVAALRRGVARLAKLLRQRCKIVRRKVVPSTLDRWCALDYEFQQTSMAA